MPQKPSNPINNLRIEPFKRALRVRTVVHLFAVAESRLRLVPLRSLDALPSKVKDGERLVMWIDANDLVNLDKDTIMRALHSVIKARREVLGVSTFPGDDAFAVYTCRERGLTFPEIVAHFADQWPARDPGDYGGTVRETRERRAKRYDRQVRQLLARADERYRASLTPRQRAILKAYEHLKTTGQLPPVEPTD